MLKLIRLLICLQIFLIQIDCALAETGWSKPPLIDSKILNENRGYRVMLPANYDSRPKQQYPLLLILEGQRYGDIVAGNARFLASVGEIPKRPLRWLPCSGVRDV